MSGLARARTWAVLLAGCLLAVSGCAGGSPEVDTSATSPPVSPPAPPQNPVALDNVEADPREDTASALEDMRHPSYPEPLLDPGLIVSGGPPPDGIPAIDQPTFRRASDVSWLSEDEAVLSLTVAGETRAYPLQVMTWHEIVNDTVGGVPVAVTYCPLCNSGVAFEREVGDRVLSFGTSGMLYADNLVMYDRQTESLWPQLTGTASVGVLTGSQLIAIPMGIVGWSDFAEAHPDAWVLSQDTGHDRPYGDNPYGGYDEAEGGLLFGLPEPVDDRLAVKARVVGVQHQGDSVAVDRQVLAEAGVLEVRVGGRDLVLWHRPGQASALDDSTVAGGRDVGTVGVFDPVVDGRRLHFEPRRDGFRDGETGSVWNVLGHAVSGELAGSRLEPVTHLDTFWFAWAAFQPETRLVD